MFGNEAEISNYVLLSLLVLVGAAAMLLMMKTIYPKH